MTDTITEAGLRAALTDEVLDHADDNAIAAANVGLGFDMDEWFKAFRNTIVDAAFSTTVKCNECGCLSGLHMLLCSHHNPRKCRLCGLRFGT